MDFAKSQKRNRIKLLKNSKKDQINAKSPPI